MQVGMNWWIVCALFHTITCTTWGYSEHFMVSPSVGISPLRLPHSPYRAGHERARLSCESDPWVARGDARWAWSRTCSSVFIQKQTSDPRRSGGGTERLCPWQSVPAPAIFEICLLRALGWHRVSARGIWHDIQASGPVSLTPDLFVVACVGWWVAVTVSTFRLLDLYYKSTNVLMSSFRDDRMVSYPCHKLRVDYVYSCEEFPDV